MKLYLSVGIYGEQRGMLSLWDEPQGVPCAHHCMNPGCLEEDAEHCVELELTPEQVASLTFDSVRPINIKE